MINHIKLNEAIAYAQESNSFMKKDLAKKLWPNNTERAAATNLTNLSSGRCKTIRPDMIVQLCTTLGVSADFLFGLEEKPTRLEAEQEKKKELLDSLLLIKENTELLIKEIKSL